jgi:dTDP-4-dehydrorhamnose reductase
VVKKEKILITGGSGLLALNYAAAVKEKKDVVLGLHERNVLINGVCSVFLNLDSVESLYKSLSEIKPNLVIHTVGLTNIETCEKNPQLAEYINVKLASNIATVSKNLDIKFVFISTDQLFEGKASMYNEMETVVPLNIYGSTKAKAEKEVLDIHQEAMIIRTNFYGWGTTYRHSFSDFIYYQLKNKQPVELFFDVFYTPILIEKLVEIIEKLVALNCYGIFNIVSEDRISKFDFGIKIADVFGFNHSLISPVSINTRNDLVMRPADMSLNNEKTTKLLEGALGKVSSHLILLKKQLSDNRYKEITLL